MGERATMDKKYVEKNHFFASIFIIPNAVGERATRHKKF